MAVREFPLPAGSVAVYYTDAEPHTERAAVLYSFSTCFEISQTGTGFGLPKPFRRRGPKIFCRARLRPGSYHREVSRVECAGTVTFSDLRRLLPSIFDVQYIRAYNRTVFINQNRTEIVRLLAQILDESEILALLATHCGE